MGVLPIALFFIDNGSTAGRREMVREDLNRDGETTPSKTEITVREDLNRRR